ncbi:MAG TPA: hypothetical protein VFM18_21835 [Methanosarcina sp.]|nr:hypothetical protein [Methanosarcina sp.]
MNPVNVAKVVSPKAVIKKKPKFPVVSLVKTVGNLLNKANPGSNSHYVFQTEDGRVHDLSNDICFARFKGCARDEYDGPYKGIIKARLFFNQDTRFKGKELEAFKKYITWVVRKSPWSKAFLNKKDSYNDWRNNGLSLNCDLPHTFVVGAMVAVREGWEYETSRTFWFDFQEKYGLSPELSYILLQYVYKDGTVTGGCRNGHGTMDSSTCFSAIKSFKKGVFNPKLNGGKPLKESASAYRGIVNIWDADNDYQPLYNHIQKISNKKGDGWNARFILDFNNPEIIKKLKELDNV